MLLLAVLTLFSACSSDENEYTPAQIPAETNEYRFATNTQSSVILALSDTLYQVEVERSDVSEAVTLPLNVKGDLDVFSVPETVTFEAGENSVVVDIAIAPTMQAFKNYYLEISIDEDYVNPYTEDNFSVMPITFLKEDYAPLADGVYTSFLFGAWKAVLEYSQVLDLYRFKDCWVKGDVTFRVTDPETMAFEMTASSFSTGYNHPTYGMIYANVLEGNYFDAETNTFYFKYDMVVSAGSFGKDYDTFQITELHD